MKTTCKHCQTIIPVDASGCLRCGTPLLWEQTHELTESDLQRADTLRASDGGWGNPFLDVPQPIVLEIHDQQLMLPPQGTIVIGRWSFDTDLPLVDVDLSYFFASAKGVSRRHIMITRKNQLVYLTDLNTRNGTWLNDQPLVAYNARLLRNNDRLRLGSLNMRVLFGEISWPPDSVVHVSDNPSAWQA